MSKPEQCPKCGGIQWRYYKLDEVSYLRCVEFGCSVEIVIPWRSYVKPVIPYAITRIPAIKEKTNS